MTYKVLAKHPHKRNSFTQGLLIHEQQIYESVGRYRHSALHRYPLGAFNPDQAGKRLALPNNVFAEGISLFDNKLYLLSWQRGLVYVFDPSNFKKLHTLSYSGEGWGLSNNGQEFIMSNGSSTLLFRDPADFKILRKLTVTRNGKALQDLNELEYFDGLIWANVWHKTIIVGINPESGEVEREIDVSALAAENITGKHGSVLNGIAWDGQTLWLTGKYWPWMYQLEIQ